jgi:large subunit ribosomal protein L21
MFAVIKSGGRQYKVSVGQTFEVNRLAVEDGEQITFDEVLLIADEDTSMVGTPFVDNALVLATAVKQARGEKLIVFKYKAKKRYRHRRGHRQELTVLTIDDIIAEGKSLITGAAPVAKETPTEDIEENDELVTSTEETTEPESETTPSSTEGSGTRRRRTVKAEETETENETEE